MSVLSCPVLTTMTTIFTTTTMTNMTTKTMAVVGQAVLCLSPPSLAKKKTFFSSNISVFMFFNVFLPPTVFESLKGLTVVETIYKKSGSDQIFLLELATYHLESTTKHLT